MAVKTVGFLHYIGLGIKGFVQYVSLIKPARYSDVGLTSQANSDGKVICIEYIITR